MQNASSLPFPAIASLVRRRGIFTEAIIDLAIFIAATSASYLAQSLDRPISSALIFLAGVTVIGARSGMIRGISAALVASLIYSLLLTEPIFEFSIYTLDHLIPLIAFNASAILSGVMVGRLNDRALAAGSAEQRNAFLLRVSNELQRTLSLEDVSEAAQRWLPYKEVVALELFVEQDDALIGIDGAHKWRNAARAAYQAELNGITAIHDATLTTRILHSANKPIGVAVFARVADQSSSMKSEEFDAFASLLSIAAERCLLMERLADAEAIQKSAVLKTAILSSVSHDLRTPLTAIEASATSMLYLGETLKDHDKTAMLETILEQTERLNRYTSNILFMGQLQYGISEDQMEDVDVVDILGAVIQTVRKLFPALKVQKEFSASAAMNVRANPVMLEQLFFNIIENAAKYGNSENGILIRAIKSAGLIEISIIDWGVGIPELEQERVFDNFYRTAHTRHNEGNGLGLGIAKGFVEAFGGTIRVVSPHAHGGGTQLLIALPMIPDEIEALTA